MLTYRDIIGVDIIIFSFVQRNPCVVICRNKQCICKKKKQSYSLSIQPKFVRFESFTLRAVTKRDKTKEIKLAVILCRWSVVPSGTVPLD